MKKRRILFIGQIHDNSGYGVAARLNLKAIKTVLSEYRESFEIRAFSVSFERNSDILKDPDFKQIEDLVIKPNEIGEWVEQGNFENVIHLPIPAAYLSIAWEDRPGWKQIQEIFLKAEYNHNISAWESDEIPTYWKEYSEDLKITNFAVPSSWNKEVYEKTLEKSVSILPHPIDTEPTISSEAFSFESKIAGKFKVVAISQWQPRKDFETLIRSFYSAFHDNEDAVLIVKAYGNLMEADVSKESLQIRSQIESIKSSMFFEENYEFKCKTVFIGGVLPKEKLNRLISISDAYMTCTRGEGFGLPIAEAMVLGKPIIAPKETGHMDFVSKENFLISGHWDVAHSIPGYPLYSKFYYSHISSATKQLRKSYEMFKFEREEFDKIGNNNQAVCKQKRFTMEGVGHCFFEFLKSGEEDCQLN